jgi:hypothetical protein
MALAIRAKPDARWGRLARWTSSGAFTRRLHKEIRVAMKFSVNEIAKAIRKKMRSGSVGPSNAPLTIEIKRGRNTPLEDLGELRKRVGKKVFSWNRGAAGFIEGVNHARDQDIMVAKTIHNGTAVPVTQRMRNMFAWLSRVSEGEAGPEQLTGRARVLYERAPGVEWRPLARTTTHIIIPPRPFIIEVMKDRGLIQQVCDAFIKAVRTAVLPPFK